MILRILEPLENLMIKIGSIVLAIMTLWVFADAMGRYFFNHPLPGTLEITEEYLMVIIVFFAISYTQKVDGHVKVDIFLPYIPAKARVLLEKTNRLIILGFSTLIVIQGFQQFLNAVKLHSVSRGVLAYPLAPVYLLMVFGMVVFSVRLIYEIFSKNSVNGGGV